MSEDSRHTHKDNGDNGNPEGFDANWQARISMFLVIGIILLGFAIGIILAVWLN